MEMSFCTVHQNSQPPLPNLQEFKVCSMPVLYAVLLCVSIFLSNSAQISSIKRPILVAWYGKLCSMV